MTSYNSMQTSSQMDIEEIKKLLPHRYPFLLVDRVLEFTLGPENSFAGSKIKAIKNITASDLIFEGHFPHRSIYPGVLTLEAMAQAAALILARIIDCKEGATPIVVGLDKVRFRKKVTPGDQLTLLAKGVKSKSGIFVFDCQSFIGEDLASEVQCMATIG